MRSVLALPIILLSLTSCVLTYSSEGDELDLWTSERRQAVVAVKATGQSAEPQYGTGFLVKQNGYLLTAAHVVRDATKVEIGLQGSGGPWVEVNSGEFRDLGYDVALLKAFDHGQGYRTLPLGNSASVHRGQSLYFGGYPHRGEFDGRRAVVSAETGLAGGFQLAGNAAAGLSGAPILNQLGVVIAVLSSGIHQTPGFIEVVPLSRIRPELERYDITVPGVDEESAAPRAERERQRQVAVSPEQGGSNARSSRNSPDQPRALGAFNGRGWNYHVYYCRAADTDTNLAFDLANRIASLITSQNNVGQVYLGPWQDPDGEPWNSYHEFELQISESQLQTAFELKSLLDSLASSANSEFQVLQIDDAEFYPAMTVVVCPRLR
jgi:hypothetical protein